MATRIGGSRRKTRNCFKKHVRQKGKISLTRYLQGFDAGQKVTLKADPAVQKGLYHGRFHGQVGIVLAKRGECYEVEINDIGKKKLLVVHPVHLRTIKNN